jgi:hypothetical protein
VTGIITQGARDFGHIQYVASYKVAHSDDGVQWTVYEEQGSSKVGVCPATIPGILWVSDGWGRWPTVEHYS